MGTWGEGPFDNDAAGDLVAGMMRHVTIVLDKTAIGHAEEKPHPPYYYDTARAAAQFILAAHGTDILGGPPIEKVLNLLAKMRTDTEWLAGFREPKKIAHALDKELLAVIGRMHTCKGCRRAHNRAEMRELETMVEEAREATVPKTRRLRTRFRMHKKLRRKARARGRS